mmetsp:Transcript_52245/g.162251  ORF Transcript_52245/g.162251 Transcript_52245/m.162251 type:complete len:221 (-) Transcript_52245:1440-2102(-)
MRLILRPVQEWAKRTASFRHQARDAIVGTLDLHRNTWALEITPWTFLLCRLSCCQEQSSSAFPKRTLPHPLNGATRWNGVRLRDSWDPSAWCPQTIVEKPGWVQMFTTDNSKTSKTGKEGILAASCLFPEIRVSEGYECGKQDGLLEVIRKAMKVTRMKIPLSRLRLEREVLDRAWTAKTASYRIDAFSRLTNRGKLIPCRLSHRMKTSMRKRKGAKNLS